MYIYIYIYIYVYYMYIYIYVYIKKWGQNLPEIVRQYIISSTNFQFEAAGHAFTTCLQNPHQRIEMEHSILQTATLSCFSGYNPRFEHTMADEDFMRYSKRCLAKDADHTPRAFLCALP